MAQRIDRAASFGQNLYVDTRGAAGEPVPFTQAVINGLAHGGEVPANQEDAAREAQEGCPVSAISLED